MSRCIGCGDRIPNGWAICDWCDPLVMDEDPLPMDAEDARLDAMELEALDYRRGLWQEDEGDIDGLLGRAA